MSKDLVSVITPTYNKSNLLKKTIISVLNQTYSNFEYVIIDDGSTDDTKEVVLSFNDDRITYIKQNHCGLPAKGRNNGIKNAKGNYIAFLDHDDLWFPTKLEEQIKYFKKDQNILAIATNGIFFPLRIYRPIKSLNRDIYVNFNDLLKSNLIINSSILIKKEVFDLIGPLDESIGKFLPDYDLWLRLLRYRKNSIFIIKKVLMITTIHDSNVSNVFKINPLINHEKIDLNFIKNAIKKLNYIYMKHKDFKDKLPNTDLMKKLLYRYKNMKLIKEIYEKKIMLSKLLFDKEIKPLTKLNMIIFYYKKKKFIKNNQFLLLIEKIWKYFFDYLFIMIKGF